MADSDINGDAVADSSGADINTDEENGATGATLTTASQDTSNGTYMIPVTAARGHHSCGGPSSDMIPKEVHLHQTLDRMNDGIKDIATTLKELLLKGLNVPDWSEANETGQASKMSSRRSSSDRSLPRVRRAPKTDRSASPAPSHGSGSQVLRKHRPARSRSSSVSSTTTNASYMKTSWEVTANVRDCTWEHFMNRFSGEEAISAIEVLVAGPNLGAEMEKENAKRARDSSESKSRDAAHEEEFSHRSPESWIHRVRIQSAAINDLLRMVAWSREEHGIWDSDAKTFKRPFRLFVRLQAKIQEQLRVLKEYQSLHPIPAPEDSISVSAKKSITGAQHIDIAYIAKIPGAVDQIQCYIDFVEDRILPVYRNFDVIRPKSSHQVRFDDLWYIFRVGDLLYAPKKDVSQGLNREIATAQTIWRIFDHAIPDDLPFMPARSAMAMPPRPPMPPRPATPRMFEPFTVQCYYVDYDGTEFGAVTTTFDLEKYDGERKVTSLPVYPLRFAPNYAQLLAHAQSTGENFLANIENPNRYGSYSGWTLMHNPLGEPAQDTRGEFMRTPEHISSDIIVDMQEGFNQCPTWKPETTSGVEPRHRLLGLDRNDQVHILWSDSTRYKKLTETKSQLWLTDGGYRRDYNEYIKHDKYLAVKIDEEERRPTPSGEDLALLPRRIVGYALWERKFVQLDVRFLHHVAVEDKHNPFEKLQIEPIHKTLIQSIVTSHFTRNDLENKGTALGTQDIIRGKGKGVVILLHGVPGVGKTATAEAVAQKWGRPLFPITCGDLGSTAESVEKSLNGIFRLAHLWDCVLLLDEADVFITQRTKSDLQRNALVSVFLRMLEYYNGILFLTTNRPGVIDEAVKSRVHLSLRYDALNLEQTRAIFEQNISQLRDIEQKRATALNEKVMDIFEHKILAFAEEHWNSYTDHVGRWNGRQIRNAFSIAASLAHFEAQEKPGRDVQLRPEHFRQVEATTLVYDKYRASILTGTDGEIAKAHEARNDDFNEHAPTAQGPQQRGQRATGISARYSQGQGGPSTPVRRQDQYGHIPQVGGSPLPPGGHYAPQAGGYSPAQHGGYIPAHQGSYHPPQAGSYAHGQLGGQLPVQHGGSPLPRPGFYAPGQQGGHPPAPRGSSPTPQRGCSAPHDGNYPLASQGPEVSQMTQAGPYDGQAARGQTAYGNLQDFVYDGSQVGMPTQPQQMQQP